MTSISYGNDYVVPPTTTYNTGVNTNTWQVNDPTSEYNQTNNTYTHNVLNPNLIHNHTNNDWIRNIYSVDFVYDTAHNNYQTNRYDLGQFQLPGNTTSGYTPGVNQYLGHSIGNQYGGQPPYGQSSYTSPSYNNQPSYSAPDAYQAPSSSYGGGSQGIEGLLMQLLSSLGGGGNQIDAYSQPQTQYGGNRMSGRMNRLMGRHAAGQTQGYHNNSYTNQNQQYGGGSGIEQVLEKFVSMLSGILGGGR